MPAAVGAGAEVAGLAVLPQYLLNEGEAVAECGGDFFNS